MKSEVDALADFSQQIEQAVADHPMVPSWVRQKIPVVMPTQHIPQPMPMQVVVPGADLEKQLLEPLRTVTLPDGTEYKIMPDGTFVDGSGGRSACAVGINEIGADGAVPRDGKRVPIGAFLQRLS